MNDDERVWQLVVAAFGTSHVQNMNTWELDSWSIRAIDCAREVVENWHIDCARQSKKDELADAEDGRR